MLMLAQNSGEFCYLNPPGPLLQRGNPNLAEGDPLPIFLKSFYNNEVGKEAPEAGPSLSLRIDSGSLAPLDRLDQAEIINYGCLNQH